MKYYIIVNDEYGRIIFKSTSRKARLLLKRYEKASHSASGEMYQSFYFGSIETNISASVEYAVYCGKDI